LDIISDPQIKIRIKTAKETALLSRRKIIGTYIFGKGMPTMT
jgi:hypothetical protein